MADNPPALIEWGWRFGSALVALVGGYWLGVWKTHRDRRIAAKLAFLSAAEPVLFAAQILDEDRQDHRAIWRTNREIILNSYFAVRRFMPVDRRDSFDAAYFRYQAIPEKYMALDARPQKPWGRVRARKAFIESLRTMVQLVEK